MKPHVFVAMPFGEKENINFNLIYDDFIKPAVESSGMEIFRADKEERAGEIRVDMFQELLIADLVIVDVTINNPNVWYELGVRHALRSRGVIIISGGSTKVFDIYTDRKLRYTISDGKVSNETLEIDKRNLSAMISATINSWHGRKISPVYQLLPNLQEPDWKSLKVGDVVEFWEKHKTWENQIELARKSSRIGDILVLANEVPISAFRSEAWIIAGSALRRENHYDYALEVLERALEIEPKNINGLREKGMCIQRLAISGNQKYSLDQVKQHYENILECFPKDTETWALLGRVLKDEWLDSIEIEDKTVEERKEDAKDEKALLKASIESYLKAYKTNLGHYYSGINALTLMCLYQFLVEDNEYKDRINVLAGSVKFAAELEDDKNGEFWAKATLGDVEVLVGDEESVKESYKNAIVLNNKDTFALESCTSQLNLLKTFGFNSKNVETGLAVFHKAIKKLENIKDNKLNKNEKKFIPKRVFLFSGHMIDSKERIKMRFPSSKVDIAKEKMFEILEKFGANSDDLALTQGAAGGDIIFTETCNQLDVKVNWMQPFIEAEFLQKSVLVCGEEWKERYFKLKDQLYTEPIAINDMLGSYPKSFHKGYEYERCNLWLLYTALSYGIEKVHFICLWDGEKGAGPGGTEHMYNEVNTKTGKVTWINTNEL